MARILIVEDETDAAILLGERLSSGGFEVLTASDAYESIDVLRKETIDLVLLDLMLPAGGGLTVLKNLRQDKKTAACPVIILTANRSPGYKQKVMDEGVQAYIEKPYDSKELMETINKLLKKTG